jgi:Fe2+ or Zn2+ uptake regulation protein/O6-methylguanine-DNA--protein-cysteine methyltransferase
MPQTADRYRALATAPSDRLGPMADDALADLLRQRELRVTPQRRAILQAFRGRADEHLAADEVLSRASVLVPEISRGTVYATLAELTELGLLAAVGTPEPVRYETNLVRHDHFHCRLCLRLFDVDLGGDELSRRSLAGYQLERVAVRAEGVCAECRDYERGLVAGADAVIRRRTLEDSALAQLTCSTISTPLGGVGVAASSEGIVRVAFEDHADFPGLAERARSRRGPVAGRRHLGGLAESLQMYFDGSRNAVQDPIDWRPARPGAADALLAVHEIPYGQPRSYEKLHGELSAYDRGYTMGSNPVPLMIPCHRVSCGSLRPTAYVGGAERLRLLRELEAAQLKSA